MDFARSKPRSASEKAQNKTLIRKYDVCGFPTVVVLDSREKRLGELGYEDSGYEKGGASKWLAELNAVTKN